MIKMYECVVENKDSVVDLVDGTQVFNHVDNEWILLPDGESDADSFWKSVSDDPKKLIEYTTGAIELLDENEDDVLTVIRLPFMQDDILSLKDMILVAGSDAPPGARPINWLE